MITKILVSQPKPQTEKSPYYDVAKKYGVEIVFRPFIKVEPMTAKDFKKQKVTILDYTAVIFTSRHAIDHFFNLCKELRVSVPDTMKYFCKSEQIALYIQKYVQYRKRKVFFSTSGKIEDLVPIMIKHKSERYLAPQSSAHNNDMKNMLDAAGLYHTEATMYYTVSNDFEKDEPFDYNMLVFFSPEGINSLMKNFPKFKQKDIAIACLGQKTIEAAKNAGLRVDMVPTAELRSVPAIIEDYIKKHPIGLENKTKTKTTTKKTATATKKTTSKTKVGTKSKPKLETKQNPKSSPKQPVHKTTSPKAKTEKKVVK
ncbi:MAG: uroporphyrinogen-III synthase [Prevotellaceae bacterium]|nr:uroporphyrinogen-III synthase [Candidatus Colivivens equi]